MITNNSSERKEALLKYMSIKPADFYVHHLGSYNNLAKENLKLINDKKRENVFYQLLYKK